MTRLINRPADVTMGPGGVPVSFRLEGCRYKVREILDCWLETGRWWEQENEQKTYRVVTFEGGIYELSWDVRKKRWHLYKAYD